MTLRIGWFSTGRGEGSRALLSAAAEAIRAGELDGEIAFLFCNRDRGEQEATDAFLGLAESYGITTITLSSRRFRRDRGGALSKVGESLPAWRSEYDRAVAALVEAHPFDVGVLVGYMLIFTKEMAGRFPFLNLHPAEPGGPVGTWQEVVWQLIDDRAERSGVMVHLATEELDRGPPVAYCTFSIRGTEFEPLWDAVGTRTAAELREAEGEEQPLFKEIRRLGAARELPLVVQALRAVAEGRVRIEGRQVVDREGRALPRGLDVSAAVELS